MSKASTSELSSIYYQLEDASVSESGTIIKNCEVELKNGDSFTGTLKDGKLNEGTLTTTENSETIHITAKFSHGVPYGYAEISKPDYKFQGLLRPYEASTANRGLIDPIYGHI